jgi:polyhydroxybutyrate depolymerase
MKGTFCFILFFISFFTSKSQVITDSVLVENHYRTFHFSKPTQSVEKFNLIFVLHGSGGDGVGIMKPATNLEKQSADNHILLVYPDGYKRYWNECRKLATSAANIENINEQSFFYAMVDYFKRNYGTDAAHFFAIGISGGGHMAYKLALTMPDKCKAITAVVANLPDADNLDCAESKVPVSVMIINGTNDPTNPYSGGPMIVNGSSYGNVRSTDNSFRYWANLAGYKCEPAVDNLPDADTTNKQTITRFTFKEKNKPEIILLKVVGGVHGFPGDIDAFTESWKFFKRQLNGESRY